MPASFNNCVKKGGRVRTKNLGKGRYIHICFMDGKSFAGETKKRKKSEGQKLVKTLSRVHSE